ncbi:PH and SEC7 domain-containing protein-like isoform X2 [Lineus longissimus]|uniref:PH and SEC7 domain-containing protein-like isoform X2 n=1 Tax=Lineus longissimus TaxID=88925 RepID=UPI00315C9854
MADTEKLLEIRRDEVIGFGFSILGGYGSELPPVIFDILKGSPACRCSQLEIGDVILQVNNVDVTYMTTKEVLKVLKDSGPDLRLKLKRDPDIATKTWRYLSSPHNLENLKNAISREDLAGVDEIIAKCESSPHNSPRHKPKSPRKSPKPSSQSSRIPRFGSGPSPKTGNKMAAVVKESPASLKKVADKPMNGSCGGSSGQDKQRIVSPEKTTRKAIPVFKKKEKDIHVLKKDKDSDKCRFQQNGLEDEVLTAELASDEKSVQRRGDAGFETFVMTGDMIIRTSAQKGNKKSDKKETTPEKSDSPTLVPNTAVSHTVPETKIPRVKKAGSPKSDLDSKVESSDNKMDNTANEKLQSEDKSVKKSPSEDKSVKKSSLEDKSVKKSPSEDKSVKKSASGEETLPKEDKIPSPTVDSNKSSPYSSSPEKSMNGLAHDKDMDKSSSDQNVVNNNKEVSDKEEERFSDTKGRSMVVSKSAEKVTLADLQQRSLVVRSSKSQENYLENSDRYLMVDIDIDDKIASSVDALLCDQSTESSLEKLANSENDRSEDHISKSEQSSPERRPTGTDIYNERVVVPGFVSLEEQPVSARGKSDCRSGEQSSAGLVLQHEPDESETDSFDEGATGHFGRVHDQHSNLEGAASSDSDPDNISDSDSIYHQPTKDVDRPSASRLAKRLYNLDGFKKSDVSRHLSKKNDFAQLVGEEYLKYFDFTDDTLDMALRQFLSKFALTGETQERERILAHFSKRYVECNPNSYASEDACHTLVCAIMLLNTDLHGQNIGRKMTCSEFIENLADLNDGENFPREVLKAIYNAIKTEPLSWSIDEEEEPNANLNGGAPQDQKVMGSNPFLEVPDPQKTKEYISGYVMRKCVQDPDGRKTPMGKRSWKMFYATLKDMILYLHKDEQSYKKQAVYQMNNAIRIHHSLATKATDYTKKQHVLKLQTADWSTYLFQTSDSKELQRWIDTINFVAASLSAPPLPGACGSQRKFQRPLMPSSYTKLNLQEQMTCHEKRVEEIERELKEHRQYPPEKGAKARMIQDYLEKESYQEFELKRFKTYAYLLQSKMTIFPELEPSLVETAIGEVDEPPSPTSPRHPASDNNRPQPKSAKQVQRSLSDRYDDDDIDPRGYRAKETEDTWL